MKFRALFELRQFICTSQKQGTVRAPSFSYHVTSGIQKDRFHPDLKCVSSAGGRKQGKSWLHEDDDDNRDTPQRLFVQRFTRVSIAAGARARVTPSSSGHSSGGSHRFNGLLSH